MYPDKSILLVDDEQDYRQLLSARLTRKGYRVWEAGDGTEALARVASDHIQLILLDLKMPGMDGLTFLKRCKQSAPWVQVIVVTGHGTIETAIEAMKSGAYDYLTKPYNLNELEALLEKALEKQQLEEENTQLKEALSASGKAAPIIAVSSVMKELLSTAVKLAQTDSSVLLRGESGTGKDLVARFIFENSPRSGRAFVPINMGAIPDAMLESELFGHEKGAFTGAVSPKKGLVEIAHQGTLFLDEIGDLPYPLQVKLLRFLETGEFRRIGSNRLQQVDVRIIAATNVDLERRVEEGSFRADLFYRLHVVDICLPPLRERQEDILPLAEHFLKRLERKYQAKALSEQAKAALAEYSYPGNIRELAHMIERGLVLSKNECIEAADLFPQQLHQAASDWRQASTETKDAGDTEMYSLKQLECQHIRKVLSLSNWNKTRAAKALGISVRNLYRKIEEYGLRP
ncbi:sigma-54 dependent transcriptional regulator [Brevibacillus ruminantium]|uniref:Sigma-54 dependent transcriptional regulator n=1 Tax=Brevibacillus ruminantium TaxID=2950604 RepID=A0ABY4WBV1_9BACL|nr:sigma-54 dependent transcriptional regulator [Brevibacillus ruminantium]USG64522.1 sigma-54 dependent transcriptional regulator [Brevibacillus ruminantium]